ncbi:MAG: RNA-protein complex protein Nop10 [archaeon]|nr:RNA-protein complex protein Nop10 [Nanoarchaeota archaeon]
MKHIMVCQKCKVYSMKKQCPKCSGEMVLAKPPKYSPEDKLGSYRREAKKKDLENKGFI